MNNAELQPYLSIVIPARNEEHRLPPTLARITRFLSAQPYASEVIVVENGSTDRTNEVVERFVAECVPGDRSPRISLLHSPPGKGAAVKTGMLAARGEFLVLSDTDLAVPIEEVRKFLPPALPKGGYAVAIASREVPGAVRHGEPGYRHLMGRVFNLLVRLLALPGIQDTQCGFKCFSREAAGYLFPLQSIDGWGFDVEVLYIARRHGLRIVEVPVDWYYGADSRVRPIQDTVNMVRELLQIRANGRRGLYDSQAAAPFTDKLPAA